MEENIKIKLTPIKDLYPKTASDYRIYSCTTEEIEKVKLNEYLNFVITGEMPELQLFEEYDAELQETMSPKYGIGYKVISIKREIPKTVEGQYAFLRTIIAESYVKAIQAAYPNEINIVDMICNGTLDYKNIKGIGDAVFQRIQNAVKENLEIQDLLTELSALGVTRTIINKLVEHYNGNTQLVLHKIRNNIYVLCEEVSGIGFKKVDKYALERGVKPDSPYRIMACMDYWLKKEEEEGNCWLDKDILIEKVMDETDLDYKTILNVIKNDAAKSNQFYIDEYRIGRYKTYQYEYKIAEYVKKMNQNPVLTVVNDLDARIKEIETIQGFEFTDEQINAIKTCVENNIVVISGRAGSGKTSVLKGVLGVLNNYTYMTCSLSGKAVQRITEATGLHSKTIHRLLGYIPGKGFSYNEKNKLFEDIIVLDEASMVNSYIFSVLISAIKDGGKLIILGDTEQLPSIGAGNVLNDLIASGVVKVCELTKVHRQAQMSGILSYANMVRDGIQINKRGDYETKTVGELQDLTLIPFKKEERDDIPRLIVDICRKVKDRINLDEFQIIVPMKERGGLATKALNLQLQPIFNPNQDEGLRKNGYEYKVGDKIIKRGNDYDNDVYNGTLGYVIVINHEDKIADFKFVSKDEFVKYTLEDMKDIDMAYALTIHSNQGSEYENVICALDFSAYNLLSRQLVYTMLTRAKKKCMFLFENEALRYAIDTDASIQRNTFLLELLRED